MCIEKVACRKENIFFHQSLFPLLNCRNMETFECNVMNICYD